MVVTVGQGDRYVSSASFDHTPPRPQDLNRTTLAFSHDTHTAEVRIVGQQIVATPEGYYVDQRKVSASFDELIHTAGRFMVDQSAGGNAIISIDPLIREADAPTVQDWEQCIDQIGPGIAVPQPPTPQRKSLLGRLFGQ